jgi:hypothetical protein
MNHEAYKYPAIRERFEFVSSQLPWLHVKRTPNDWPVPWVDGMVKISFQHSDAKGTLELILELCNDYGGVLETLLFENNPSFYIYFPNQKGEKIFGVVGELEKDSRLIGARIVYEGWGGWYRTGSDPYFSY